MKSKMTIVVDRATMNLFWEKLFDAASAFQEDYGPDMPTSGMMVVEDGFMMIPAEGAFESKNIEGGTDSKESVSSWWTTDYIDTVPENNDGTDSLDLPFEDSDNVDFGMVSSGYGADDIGDGIDSGDIQDDRDGWSDSEEDDPSTF